MNFVRMQQQKAPVTIQSQLMAGMRTMTDGDQGALASLLERWLHSANIDLSSPPMLGEEDAGEQ